MIELTSSTGNRTTRFWQAQDDSRQIDGETDVFQTFGRRPDAAILSQLEAVESYTYTGIVTGNRLSQQAGYSNDPVTALAEWTAEAETFIDARQGDGHTLTDNERGETLNGVVTSFGWQRESGAELELRWDLEFWRGRASMRSEDQSIPNVSPSSTATLDGWDLGDLKSWRSDLQQTFEPFPVAYPSPGENELKSNGGVVRKYTIRGQIIGTTDANSFDSHIRSLAGSDTTVTFEEPFPGRSMTVMVDTYDSIREAGVPRFGTYDMTLIQGVTA